MKTPVSNEQECAPSLAASCKEAARLMSESRDRKLDEIEQADLEIHWSECKNCVRFDKQLSWLSDLAKSYAQGQSVSK
jgi:hypothetical protein